MIIEIVLLAQGEMDYFTGVDLIRRAQKIRNEAAKKIEKAKIVKKV